MKWLVLIGLLSIGCNPPVHSKRRVTLYSGSTVVRQWKEVDKVRSYTNSQSFYFTDPETGELVTISGTVVIERDFKEEKE